MNLAKKAVSFGTSAALVASLLATVVAPVAQASTATGSVGTFLAGTTSTATGSFTFTENAAASWANAAGTLTVVLTDYAGAHTLGFVGPVTVTAPGSLGASYTLTNASAPAGYYDTLTINTTASDINNVEQITVSGWKIVAASGAAAGAINATLGGSLAPGLFGTTATATGTLQAAITGAAAQTVNVLVTSTCGFAIGPAGLNTTANFSDASDARSVTAAGAVSGGIQSVTFGAGAAGHPFGTTVTQTVAACAGLTTLASPGTIGVAAIQNVTAAVPNIFPGEQNQAAAPTFLGETASSGAGYIPVGTLTFKLSPAGVLFSAAPSVSYLGGAAGGALCTLSFDRTSCSVSVTTASTAVVANTVTLYNVALDVASTVAAGSAVNVTITSSPAITVSVTANTIAYVGRVIVGVAAQPTIYINYNDQSTGLITLTEQGPGFFNAGTASNNTFGLCLTSGETFTRLPYAVVTVGDLKLLNGVVGGTSVLGTYGTAANCVYWTVYSASTVASTIEIRGSDATGAVLPTGPTNGPRLSVGPGLAPGTTQAWILNGTQANVSAGLAGARTTLVSFATRAYKSGVVVAAVSQPFVPAGTTGSLAGNLTISETLNGQFKPGQDICVTILPRAANGVRTQDTFINSSTTNNLPVITTNSASGLLTSSVGVPGCSPEFYYEFYGAPYLPNAGASFTFSVSQQSFGGTLGVITISNINLITTADAVSGPVLLDVMGDTDGGAVAFESVVSNATIGVQPTVKIGAATAVGATKNATFTSKTKVVKLNGYVTWKFSLPATLVGKTVTIWVATKQADGTWGASKALTSRLIDLNGNAYFWWKFSSPTWVAVKASYGPDASYAMSVSASPQARWMK